MATFRHEATRVASVVMREDGTTWVMFWPIAGEVELSLDQDYEVSWTLDRGRPIGPPRMSLAVRGVGEAVMARTFEDAMHFAAEHWRAEDEREHLALDPVPSDGTPTTVQIDQLERPEHGTPSDL